jgi:hypothetical protein
MKQVRIGDITIDAVIERGLVRTDGNRFNFRFKRD